MKYYTAQGTIVRIIRFTDLNSRDTNFKPVENIEESINCSLQKPRDATGHVLLVVATIAPR